ncbi:MAG: hypothetical protein GKR87_16205 [Kiritimatiellae bacterium]|nr:hypothetical protein [Kiritimatiellia bacterium]
MDQLEDHLCEALKQMSSKRHYTKSLCGFSCLVNCILNALERLTIEMPL